MKKPTMDSDSQALLCLLADIRAAVGDPKDELMQDELVEHCKRLKRVAREADAFCHQHAFSKTVPAGIGELMSLANQIQWPKGSGPWRCGTCGEIHTVQPYACCGGSEGWEI